MGEIIQFRPRPRPPKPPDVITDILRFWSDFYSPFLGHGRDAGSIGQTAPPDDCA